MPTNGRIKASKKAMTRKEIEKIQRAVEERRKDHADINALRKAYRDSIPEQVRASMAFEGDHVSIEMLEEYLKSLKSECWRILRLWRGKVEI